MYVCDAAGSLVRLARFDWDFLAECFGSVCRVGNGCAKGSLCYTRKDAPQTAECGRLRSAGRSILWTALRARDITRRKALLRAAKVRTFVGIAIVKVLHVIASVDRRGGGPIEGVFSSSAVWSRHGHVRHILTLDVPSAPCIADSPVQTFAVGMENRWYRFLRAVVPWFRYGYSPHLTHWLKIHAKSYDAVVVNGLWNYASYGSWRALHKLATPYFVFPHGMLDPWFNKTYPIKSFFKSIFWKLFAASPASSEENGGRRQCLRATSGPRYPRAYLSAASPCFSAGNREISQKNRETIEYKRRSP
jgi:hypothetical protein